MKHRDKWKKMFVLICGCALVGSSEAIAEGGWNRKYLEEYKKQLALFRAG